MRKLVAARRLSQTFFLLLFVYILWSTTYPLEGFLPPETFFRTNPLIMIFTSLSERLLLPGLAMAGVMLVLTLILGRFYCGWVCPLGSMIDAAGAFKKRKFIPSEKQNRSLKLPKFIFLGLVAVSAAAGFQTAWILDPMVIMGRFVSLNLIPTVTLGIDRLFIFLLRRTDMYVPLYDSYRWLRSSILGVKVAYFANSGIIFGVIALIMIAALFLSRAWCRAVCPLGALYALAARYSLVKRNVSECVQCGSCVKHCRTGAIKDNAVEYSGGECVMCMDCVYDCPVNGIAFSIHGGGKPPEKGGIDRRDFLILLSGAFLALGAGIKKRTGRGRDAGLIRPPAALKEKDFVDRCIRCGNCMKVCPTNGLQPSLLQAGAEGIWTPHLVPEIGYCEYQCNLCGNVCPTGAIEKLSVEEKMRRKLGTARVDRTMCIAWAQDKECIVCEEHCPVANKAIKIDEKVAGGKVVKRPVVDKDLCVGCGICQNKCPVRPERAIKVYPEGAERS